MPTFGDYETVGEPVAITDEGGRVSTIWQAKKRDGHDNRQYAVKCFAPHQRTHRADAAPAEETLDADRSLEFLESVKQLKKARSEGGRCLAPIHAFGTADEGAWYVTDYCKRTLKSWIALRGVVVDAALRHVVHSLATGCLALQKSCGRSHGNLKVANVFLVGKSRAFREMPLELIDPRPASSFLSSRPGAGDSGQISEIAEVSDLHSIGLVILQLVEGRIVRSEHDYNYPIANSPSWDKLGKESERWRQLCNQLLDPHLSLAEVNLESLAKQFRPSAVAGKLPLILAAAGVVCAVGVGIYFLIPGTDKKYREHLAAAQSAYDTTNLVVARQEIDSALKYKPLDPAVADLKAKIDQLFEDERKQAVALAQQELRARNLENALKSARRALELTPSDPEAAALAEKIQQEQAYQTAIAAVAAALSAEDYDAALQHANEALKVRPDDVTAKNLAVQAQAGRARKEFDGVFKEARAAFDRQDYVTAAARADAALRIRPNDPDAGKLKRDAGKRQRELATQTESERKYGQALAAAQTAFDHQDFATAANKADAVLAIRPGDAAATKLKHDAEKRQRDIAAQTENDRNYNQALTAAQAAFDRQDYSVAITQAGAALVIKPNDSAAAKLKRDAEQRQREFAAQAESERNYKQAMTAAQAAFDRQDYAKAMTEADAALGVRPNDSTAAKLRTDAERRQREAVAQSENERKYNAAMTAAQTALDRQDFAKAMTEADAALAVRPNDTAATKLKADADRRRRDFAAQVENENKYKTAMTAAQAAYERQDYATAATQADAALVVRPNDGTASKLKSDAERRRSEIAAQAENDKRYKQAMTSAQTAFDHQDYATAATQAAAALAARPNDSAAAKLKSDAETRQRELVAQAENERKYKEAMTAAQTALNRQDYATAVTQAEAALGVRPDDPAAAKLKSQAGDARDLQAAQAAFQNGDYSNALTICAAHKGVPGFETLAKSIGDEQKALADARLDTGDDSYSFIEKLKAQTYSSKPSFVTLLNQAENERKNLGDLRKLKDNGKWQAVKQKLSELTPAGFLHKAPFTELGGWADGQAAAAEQEVKKLDAQFEVLLVEFNKLKAKKAQSPEAQRAAMLPALSLPEKTYYKGQVDELIKSYTSLGWINKPSGKISSKNTFGKDLAELKDVIEVW